jgi:capsule polysaccharide export protein KpsE/RkpR
MARDWSATRQAEENVMQKRASEHNHQLINSLRSDIDTIEVTLDSLSSVQGNDSDLLTAVRSLGAYQATLKRKLAIELRGS